MKEWYAAVCDDNKEFCHIIINGNYNAFWSYLEDIQDLINAFLCKSYGHSLRMIHRDDELDFVHENKYLSVHRLTGEAKKQYIRTANPMWDSVYQDEEKKARV